MRFATLVRAIGLFAMLSEQHSGVAGVKKSLADSCIALVAQRYFRANSSVAVLTSDSYDQQYSMSLTMNYQDQIQDDNLVRQMSLNEKLSFVTLKLPIANASCYENRNGSKSVDYFIMTGKDDYIFDAIRHFCCGTLVDDRTHFLVYLETEKSFKTTVVESVLEELWTQQQQNIVILVRNGEVEIDVYTWFPLRRSPEVQILDRCNGQRFRNNVHLFPPKEPHNLNGKVIKVGVAENPPALYPRIGGGFLGLDIDILDAMASTLNFKTEFLLPSDLKRENDESLAIPYKNYFGPWKTIMLRTHSGDVDVGIGGMLLTSAQIGYIGYIQIYKKDTIEFFATNDLILSTRTERWVAVVILQMVFVLVSTSLAMNLLQNRRNHEKRETGFGRTVMMIWAFLTDSAGLIRSLSSQQVIVWTALSFFVINMNTAYKSFLASVLASPVYIEKIQTVKDMAESDLPFLTAVYFQRYSMTVLTPQEYSKLTERMVVCVDPLVTCLLKFWSSAHHCLTSGNEQLNFVMSALPNRAYHRLDRPLVAFYVTFFTRKDFFLNRKMTKIILRSAQAGLIDFWYEKALRNHRLCDFRGLQGLLFQHADSQHPVSVGNSSRHATVLTMAHLLSPFLLLGMGLFLAGAVFIVEVLSVNRICKIVGARLKCTSHRRLNNRKLDKIKHKKQLPPTSRQILPRITLVPSC